MSKEYIQGVEDRVLRVERKGACEDNSSEQGLP